jgi:RHH-type proline utilization regulon transcriptional repressor/proline dehydrogenase/delta 1-pyrroline-5-carboxylate dehydrogenase
VNPTNYKDVVGECWHATQPDIDQAFKVLGTGFKAWNATSIETRAEILNNIADLYHENRLEIMGILVREAGKSIPDAIGEVREAIDFCRYYAVQGVSDFAVKPMEGPTGEENLLWSEGRGVFVCISPWNFPFAIFTGQIVAALMAGNSVISKPAEQTPAIASYAIQLMIEAGVPVDVIALLQGDGEIGGSIIQNDHVAGVAFTGSTQVAKIIQRTLANKDGPIIPLIAETGGLNAMIVDSTALPEQVTDDAIHSAFGSAGQRCSALRILCLQNDIADDMIHMIKGAMQKLKVGNPALIETDVGPIIDQEALANLTAYRSMLEGTAKSITIAPCDDTMPGYFFAPLMAELDDIDMINKEAFGPIMHVVRYDENKLHDLIEQLNAKGYGLTFGLHTRIHKRFDDISNLVNAGNIYINRGQTGAVVGSQPFGGRGLSGTGPKAGGPHYLHAFATEKSISNDITASGGNASLLNLS